MKKKIVGIFVCMLLILSGFILPIQKLSSGDPLQDEVLDQAQETCGICEFFENYAWQTFVPTQTTLARVEVCIAQNFGLSPDITMSIERPLETSLTSKTLPASALPDTNCDWVSFDVPDISLIPGETYYIVISYPLGGEYSWCGSWGNLYVPGNSNREVDWDWCFRTIGSMEEVEGPDLVITDIWNDGEEIWYQLRNIGNIPTDAGHSTALFVDDVFIVSDNIPETLNPGERTNRVFDYPWVCTSLNDIIEVIADYGNSILERNETNNNRVEQWNCDNQPPEITSGPFVLNVTQNTVEIYWETSEESNSLVSYGNVSGVYSHDVKDVSFTYVHSILLLGLEPLTTYHFLVQSEDLTGNIVQSDDIFFETLPESDNILPTVDIDEIGECKDFIRISANADDNQGVEKVIFYINNISVFTDFSPPFEFFWDTTRYPNGPYDLKSRVVDFMGQTSEDHISTTVANVIDETAPQVRIVYPHSGETLTNDVLITAYLQDDVDLKEGICYVDGIEHARTTYPEKIDYVAYTYLWDTYDVSNGMHRIGVVANDSEGKTTTRYVDVMVDNPPKAEPNIKVIGHSIFQYYNKANVKLIVQNVGMGTARNVTIVDYLSGFLPISDKWGNVFYTAQFDSVNKISRCVIEDKTDLLPNEERQYEYTVIPILFDPVPSLWIGVFLQISFETLYYEKIIGPMPFAVNAKNVNDAYYNALKQSDYLLLTNPQRLFDNFGGKKGGDNDVNTLLSTMAELAYYRNGVLGFVYTIDKLTIRNLIKPGGIWEAKMHSSTNQLKYLLIVGETGIVPSCILNNINLSDLFYANTMGDGAPDLFVGRIIGDYAVNLTRVMRTSINVLTNQPGYGFNGSNILLISGSGDHEDAFINFVNDLAKELQNESTVEKLHFYSIDKFKRAEPLRNHSSNQSVICYRGHGNFCCWDDVYATNFYGPPLISFGTTNPFVFALSCVTGRYDRSISIAQACLDTKAGVYIGSTEVSGTYYNSEAGKFFFTNLWCPDYTIGELFMLLKNMYWTPIFSGWHDWAAEYNLYGDPKYQVVSSNTLSYMPFNTFSNEESVSPVDIQIPAYEVSSHDGFDYVDIPGGEVLLEDGAYRIPFYMVSLQYPMGVRIQDVILTEKSNLSITSGLNLPIVQNLVDCPCNNPLPFEPISIGNWYPAKECEWNVRENLDGSSTLYILMYPMKYNPLTSELRFYTNYSFSINYTESPVAIVNITTDKEEYHSGEDVIVDVEVNNTGESQDVIVNAVIKQSVTEDVIGGLLLTTLHDFNGSASFSLHWNSDCTPPGYYYVGVTLSDLHGRILDQKTSLFGLDISAGEITDFSVSPQYFDIGDEILINLTFSNTGFVAINGNAFTEIQDVSGDVIESFSHDISNLQPMDCILYNDIWDTSFAVEGEYKVISYVLYNSQSSDDMVQIISTNYPPIVHFTFNPVSPVPIEQPILFNSTGSFDPDGSIVSWEWDFGDGGMSIEQNPTHIYYHPGNYTVSLTITDNEGSIDTTSSFILVGDIILPSIIIEVPSPWEALQDGVTFSSLVTDDYGVAWVKYAIREPGGLQGTVIDSLYESLNALPTGNDKWQLVFDTTELPDGYYVLYVNASDNSANENYAIVNFSIRNWAVLEMLPNTPNSKAGRTIPVKFSLRVSAIVDPTEPFVRNEELTIKIYEKGKPWIILQISTYGSNSKDYRINSTEEHYITNFQTLKTPKTYVVEIWRNDMLIGSFEFKTIK